MYSSHKASGTLFVIMICVSVKKKKKKLWGCRDLCYGFDWCKWNMFTFREFHYLGLLKKKKKKKERKKNLKKKRKKKKNDGINCF